MTSIGWGAVWCTALHKSRRSFNVIRRESAGGDKDVALYLRSINDDLRDAILGKYSMEFAAPVRPIHTENTIIVC